MDRRSPVSDEEIGAFLDGELAPARRAEIEARLAADPRLAARIRADMRVMDALRRSQPRRGPAPEASLRAARRLERRLRRQRLLAPLRTGAIAASLFAAGWLANAAADLWLQPGPALQESFLGAAREALRLAELDAGPRPANEPVAARIARLGKAIDVVLPELPASWTVTDVRLHPWDGRSSLVVTAETARLGTVTLVAAPVGSDAPLAPTPVGDDAVPTIHWRSGGTAFALMGSAAPHELQTIAEDMHGGGGERTDGGASPGERADGVG